MKRFKSRPKYIAYVGLFSAIAAVLMLFEIPLFFAPGFYKIDLSELPTLICTFALGPVAGVICEFLKIVLKLVLKGTSSAFVGDFANFVIGCSMILPASIIYHKIKTKKGAWIGMLTGTLVMTIFGSLFNAVYLLPTFATMYGMPLDDIVKMGTAVNAGITSVTTLVFYAVVPFNVLKGVVVSILTFFLYKRTEKLLHIK
jgi:riboflavin transporter FmnP